MKRRPSGEPYWYHLVPEEKIRPDLVTCAARITAWAAKDLGLNTPPAVVWFSRRERQRADSSMSWAPHYLRRPWPRPGEPVPPPYTMTAEEAMEAALNRSAPSTLYGRVAAGYPLIVFLRTVRSPYTVARNLLHECRHVWQFANGWFPGRDLNVEETQDEGDAETYGDLALPMVLHMVACR
jgi:hypothetical protein